MSIHANGYWKGLEASSQHVYDSTLGISLTNFFKGENNLRKDSTLWWFKNTIMVFRKSAF